MTRTAPTNSSLAKVGFCSSPTTLCGRCAKRSVPRTWTSYGRLISKGAVLAEERQLNSREVIGRCNWSSMRIQESAWRGHSGASGFTVCPDCAPDALGGGGHGQVRDAAWG